MKIIRQDESHLILRKLNFGPVIFAVFPIGLGIVLMGAIPLCLYYLPLTSINCQRIEPKVVNCTIKNSHFFGAFSERNITLQKVKQAILTTKESKNNDGERIYYNGMALQSTKELVNVNTGVGKIGSLNAKDFSKQINDFLSSQSKSLVLSTNIAVDFSTLVPGFILFSLFAFALIAVGWITIKSSDFLIILDFDQTKERVFYTKAKLIPFLTKRGEKKDYPLRAITSIEIHNSQDPEDSERLELSNTYSLALVMNKDQSFPDYLYLKDYGISISDLKSQKEIADKLGDFLGIEKILVYRRKD